MDKRVESILKTAAAMEGITADELLARMFPGQEIDKARVTITEHIKVEKFADDDLTKPPIEVIEIGD